MAILLLVVIASLSLVGILVRAARRADNEEIIVARLARFAGVNREL